MLPLLWYQIGEDRRDFTVCGTRVDLGTISGKQSVRGPARNWRPHPGIRIQLSFYLEQLCRSLFL